MTATTIQDKTKELLENLEKGIRGAMNSENYKAFLRVQSQFHSYSANNTWLIYLQNEDATRVAGYKTWQKLGRQVMKGEKGIKILAPSPYKYSKILEKIDPKTQKPVRNAHGEIVKEKVEVQGIKFRTVSVFDISQTSGKELPTICAELKGDSLHAEKIIKAIKQISEVPIVEEKIPGGAKGYCTANKIALKEGMSLDQTAKTLVHEYAHSLLHFDENSKKDIAAATAEVQAESVAYVVSNHFGLDTSAYSFDYLAAWSKDKELSELKSSFDLIQKTSNQTIDKIEDVLSKELELQTVAHAEPQRIETPKVEMYTTFTKDEMVKLYEKEFPSINLIDEDTAVKIKEFNKAHGHHSIKQMKARYKELGLKLEKAPIEKDIYDYREMYSIIDDLRTAKTSYTKLKAHERAAEKRAMNKLAKSAPEIEMA